MSSTKATEVSVTVEAADIAIQATLPCGERDYVVVIEDSSGLPAEQTRATITMPAAHLGAMLSILLHPEGEPPYVDEYYKALEPIIGHLPQNLRPIP
jgi:hypothetical protein